MGRIEVLLPVRRFEVLVTYHAFDGLTPVEEHLLLAVAAGIQGTDRLATHLGLPRPLILDACIDLLSIGALEIGTQGEMAVSARTSDAMGDWRSPRKAWEATFATGAAPPADAVPLMQDTVSGSVFRALPRQPEYRHGLPRLPANPDLPPVDEIPRSELLSAVLARPLQQTGARASSDKRSVARRARIGEVRLRRADTIVGGTEPIAAPVLRSILVDVRAARQGEDAVRFAVLGPDSVPGFVRMRIGTGLAKLWERGVGRGANQVFERLQFEEDVDAVASEARVELPHAPLGRLEAAFSTIKRDPTQTDHDHLLGLERDAIAAVSRAIAAGATAQLVDGARAHHEALHEALRTARQQVILAGPWVARLDDKGLRAAIRTAVVTRGVTVVLLWGIAREEPLPASVASLRNELAQEATAGAFRVADRAAVSHAKFMVCDHDWAIVTSCNFLSSGPERSTAELGVRLTSPPPFVEPDPDDARTAPSHPISDLLRWAKDAVPDYRISRFIGDSPVLFGLGSGGRRLREAPSILPPGPVMLQLWRDAWSNRITELSTELTRTGTYALAVDSAAHREVLFDGVATARRRIMIESPTVTAVATSVPFVRAVLEARARDVEVTFRFAKREPAGPEGDARWDELAQSGVRMIKADTHAKLLVIDDWIVVSSFNFLSFEGRRRRELGIQVVDGGLAEEAASRFGSA